MPFRHDPPLIGIVGACASGKSSLIAELTRLGYNCRHIAQEHSYVPDMWQRLTNPDILVFLEVSYEITLKRKNLNWSPHEFQVQLDRLQHARQNADIMINTDELSVNDLVIQVTHSVDQLMGIEVKHSQNN